MNKFNKRLGFILIIPIYLLSVLLLNTPLHAQIIFPMFNGKIYACDGRFTDSGGELGSYKANENITTTICSDNPSKSNIKLSFYSSDIKTGDELCIYDGFDLTAPLLTCSSDHNNFPFIIEATKANSSGCLTLQFKSNNFLQGSGWKANIECIPQCQNVNADIAIASSAGSINNGYLDICPGDPIDLTANITFPENDLNYHQSEQSCTYNWIINNTIKLSGKSISLPKLTSGGYSVHLLAKDTIGCINTNSSVQKIRVAPSPEFYINAYDSVLCLNSKLNLTANITEDPTVDVSTKPGKGYFPANDFLADTFALPDGTGKLYTSTIYIDRFDPSEVIDEIEDLESICLNIEHSFLKDLEISITCPSGKKITLQNQEPSSGSIFLGVPFEGDEILPAPIPGIGFNYCWNMSSNNGNWNDYISKNSPGTLPEGSYKPYNSFADLFGCPFDGAWTISIIDLWANDNGYVFNWGVNFNPTLYPSIDTFTNLIVSGTWIDNPSLTQNINYSIISGSVNPGRVENIWKVQDQAGCRFETQVPITFLPAQHPQCLSCKNLFSPLKDTILCSGQLINLVANENKNLNKTVDFAFFTSNDFSNSSTAIINIPVSSLQPAIIKAPLSDMSSVCISMESTDLGTLGMTLVSPDGKSINLFQSGEVSGTNLKKTCFLPAALAQISSGTEPYSSNYKSKGLWTNLTNSVSSGNWKLQISKPLGQEIRIDSINLKFNILQSVNLNWKSNLNLVCPTCPVLKLPVTQKSFFELTATDLYGCKQIDTAWADILVAYPAPVVTCMVLGNGILKFSWLPINGAISYEISINGMPWEPVNGLNSQIISELKSGEVVSVKVRVSQIGIDCINEIGTATCTYTECNLAAQAQVTSTSCQGKKDGAIKVNVLSGNPPYLYSINGGLFGTSNTFSNLTEGIYLVIVSDIKYCKDTLKVVVGPPAKINPNFVLDSVSCFGLNNGKVIANTSGGFAPFTYKWSIPATPNINTVSGLSAGNYSVTITDNKSCSSIQYFTIEQPEDIKVTLNVTNVPCAGMNSGSIQSIISGGTSPYTFNWSNGAVTGDINNLQAGSFLVTVQDAHNCKVNKSAAITEPAPLVIKPTSVNPTCFGINNGSCSVVVTGGNSPYKYLWNDKNKTTTSNAKNLAPGNYKVIITDNNGCTATENFVLQDPPQLIVSVKATDEHCPGSNDGVGIVSIFSGNGPFNYTWSKAGLPNANIATGLSPGNYTVTISNNNGCSAEEIFFVNAAEAIIADITTEPVACPNSSNGHAGVNISGGYPPFNFIWNDPSQQLTQVAMGLNVGNYAVTITDSRNCQLVLPTTVTAINPVAVVNTLITNTSCYNTSDGELNIQLGGGIAPYDITWSGGLPKNQTKVSALSKGTYKITVTDAAGCYITQDFEITSPDQIKIDLASASVSCFNSADGSLTVTPTGGTAPFTYVWSNGPLTQINTNLPGGNYDVTVTDKNGCTEAAIAKVDAPSVQFDYDLLQNYKACNGDAKNEAKINITSSTGPVYVYNWSNGITNQDYINSLVPGTYDVTVTDGFGCKLIKSISVNDWDPINISFNINPATCDLSNDASIIINNIIGGAANGDLSKYLINANGAASGLTINQLSSGQSNKLHITDNQGCTFDQTIDIPVTESIKYELTGSSPTCFKGNDGSVNVKNITGGNAPYSVKWTNGLISAINSNLTSGSYSFIITDSKGCTKSDQYSIQDPAQIDLSNFAIVQNLCEYDQKGEISIQPALGKAPYSFNWSNGSTGNNIKGLASADYIVTVTDVNNCINTTSFKITGTNFIDANALTTPPHCQGELNGSIEMDVNTAKQPVSFALNNNNFQADNLFPGLGAGTYECSIMDKDGCIKKWSVEVENSPLLNVLPVADITVESGESVNVKAEVSSAGGYNVNWKSQEANIFSCDNCEETIITPTITSTCWLTAESSTGCAVKIPFTVRIIKNNEIYVPTAFSPNQDGVNDRLTVFGKTGNIIRSFKIFDQWGELVYSNNSLELNNQSQGWDGKFNGQPMNTGVFIWMADILHKDGTTETLSGESTLLK